MCLSLRPILPSGGDTAFHALRMHEIGLVKLYCWISAHIIRDAFTTVRPDRYDSGPTYWLRFKNTRPTSIQGDFAVNKKRPVNLDIGTIRLPITAYVSILHRISGVALFFATAVLLWALDTSLSSPEGFVAVQECFQSAIGKVILLLVLAGLVYHMVAGIRHLIMDCGIGESLEGGRAGAKAVLAVAIVLFVVLAGVWVW